ncbi:MAG: LPS export ABC transporter ATP-binding protein [Armatimonadetes bacterium]|nr:LPS export ABC transporter ATP-binding protein [Armatimonadota bacterium]
MAATEPGTGVSRIHTESLVKIYRGRKVVNGVSIQMSTGEIVGLLGPNGAGKTTTFYMIVGLVRPNQGHVLLDGKDITRQPMYRRARAGIGYLPQEPSIFRKLTVGDNLRLILEMRRVPCKEREERIESLLGELHIGHLRDTRAYTLSGGERRRAEIARALASAPAFILLDEPFTGVDPISITDIQQIIADLKTKGIGILITDHNVRETLKITDRVYILDNGQIQTSGPSEAIPNDPIAREFYLGKDFEL